MSHRVLSHHLIQCHITPVMWKRKLEAPEAAIFIEAEAEAINMKLMEAEAEAVKNIGSGSGSRSDKNH